MQEKTSLNPERYHTVLDIFRWKFEYSLLELYI